MCLILDSILHHLWKNRINTSWTSIQSIIDKIHLTPRTTWNTHVNTMHAIKYMSWTLNVNINLFKICETRDTCHKHKYIFKYQFQNTLIKLLWPPVNSAFSSSSINIVCFKKKYYLLNSLPNEPPIFPTLTDVPAVSSITFENVTITPNDILDIVNNLPDRSFPFSIKIFTSYSFIKSKSNQLGTNMIGEHISTNQPQPKSLYIFITPSLDRNMFFLHQLPELFNNKFNRVNPFTISPHSEGQKTNITKNCVPTVANQKECICQHEQTQELTPPKAFKNLGNITYFLSMTM